MINAKRLLIWVGVLAAIVLGLFIWLRLAFQGKLDSGDFVVVQSWAVSPNRIAMLAQRPGTKWSGNTFFALIGDHLYSREELRTSLYQSDILFEVGQNGLELNWESPEVLTVKCVSCGITANQFQVQKFSDQGVTIRYVGFPQ